MQPASSTVPLLPPRGVPTARPPALPPASLTTDAPRPILPPPSHLTAPRHPPVLPPASGSLRGRPVAPIAPTTAGVHNMERPSSTPLTAPFARGPSEVHGAAARTFSPPIHVAPLPAGHLSYEPLPTALGHAPTLPAVTPGSGFPIVGSIPTTGDVHLPPGLLPASHISGPLRPVRVLTPPGIHNTPRDGSASSIELEGPLPHPTNIPRPGALLPPPRMATVPGHIPTVPGHIPTVPTTGTTSGPRPLQGRVTFHPTIPSPHAPTPGTSPRPNALWTTVAWSIFVIGIAVLFCLILI